MLGAFSLGRVSLGAGTSLIEEVVSATQGLVTAVSAGPSAALRASQATITVAYNIPAQFLRSTQASTAVVYKANNFIRSTQAGVMAVVRGVVDNPKLRAWYYTLDGHDFYVLKLGTGRKTLVYDLSTGQWSTFNTEGTTHWRASLGMNWHSAGAIPNDYGSNVIVGDDTYGRLWVLDPDKGMDDDLTQAGVEVSFTRVATGQLPATARQFIPIYSVEVRGSLGQPSLTANTMTLEYSDDMGNTYVSANTPITIVAGNFAQEVRWRSLGVFKAPGRLFRLTDNGSMARIDSLDVNE